MKWGTKVPVPAPDRRSDGCQCEKCAYIHRWGRDLVEILPRPLEQGLCLEHSGGRANLQVFANMSKINVFEKFVGILS